MNQNGSIGRVIMRTMPLPECAHELISGTYTFSGRVLIAYRAREDARHADFYRLATIDDDGARFAPVFAGEIKRISGANGIRFMCFNDNKRVLLGDYVLECAPDLDSCAHARLIPVRYPPMADETNPQAIRWSEVVVSPDDTHVAWTALSAMSGSTNLLASLERRADEYVLSNVRDIGTMRAWLPDENNPGCVKPGVVRGGEVKQFVRGGRALSLVGMGANTRIADSIVQALDSEEITQITYTPCYDETTIFSPDEKLGIVMSTRFSPDTNCAIFALMPRPFMRFTLGGLILPIYMYSVANVRQSGRGNIGPALIEIQRSIGEPEYLGVNLSDPDGQWFYHSPMSWHPSGKKAMWNERKKAQGEGRLRICELPDYQCGPGVPPAPVPAHIPYASPASTISPMRLDDAPEFTVKGARGGSFSARVIGAKRVYRYDDYVDAAACVLNGEETFLRDACGCAYEAKLKLSGAREGEMDLRVRFKQPHMWSTATLDFSQGADGKPQTRGFARYAGQELKAEDMSH